MGGEVSARVVRANSSVLLHGANLHAHFVAAVRSVVFLLVEVGDIAVRGRLTGAAFDFGQVLVGTAIQRRLGQHLRVLSPVLVVVGSGLHRHRRIRAGVMVNLGRIVIQLVLVRLHWVIMMDLGLVQLLNAGLEILSLGVVRPRGRVFSNQVPEMVINLRLELTGRYSCVGAAGSCHQC